MLRLIICLVVFLRSCWLSCLYSFVFSKEENRRSPDFFSWEGPLKDWVLGHRDRRDWFACWLSRQMFIERHGSPGLGPLTFCLTPHFTRSFLQIFRLGKEMLGFQSQVTGAFPVPNRFLFGGPSSDSLSLGGALAMATCQVSFSGVLDLTWRLLEWFCLAKYMVTVCYSIIKTYFIFCCCFLWFLWDGISWSLRSFQKCTVRWFWVLEFFCVGVRWPFEA